LRVGDVGVGEHDLVHFVEADQVDELTLGNDRDALGISLPGEPGRVGAPVDVRDLGRGECDHVHIGVGTEDDVERVEVTPAGTGDDDAFHDHTVAPVRPTSKS